MQWNFYTFTNLTVAGALAVRNFDGYRPLQWGLAPGNAAQLIFLRDNIGGYFFDAILKTDHSRSARITEHPVQTGANITDHAYALPARLVMEIGMSDVMASFIPGQFRGGPTKSIAAYKLLVDLHAKRQPVTVVTRLDRYENMLVEHLATSDDVRTQTGLRCTVTLRQILTAKVPTTKPTSNAPQTTQTNNMGEKQAQNLNLDTSAAREFMDKNGIKPFGPGGN